ncbi:hypothetical protein, partial [Prosthecobacter sp.]
MKKTSLLLGMTLPQKWSACMAKPARLFFPGGCGSSLVAASPFAQASGLRHTRAPCGGTGWPLDHNRKQELAFWYGVTAEMERVHGEACSPL